MQRGFTLLELIITVVVAAVLLTIGLPSFQNSVRSTRLSSAVNEMVVSMQLARSEAIKRRSIVTICPNNDDVAPDANCAPDAPWERGWIVFVDDNANIKRDEGEALLRAQRELSGRLNITTPPGQPLQDSLSYAPTGFPVLGGLDAAGVMVFCDDRESDYFGRVISVPQTGRPLASPVESRSDLRVTCE